MKLYKLALINKHGYTMIEKYAVASGVNEAKRLVRDSSPYYKGLKLKLVESSDVLVSQPTQSKKETGEEFFKRFDSAWDNKEMWGGEYGEGI